MTQEQIEQLDLSWDMDLGFFGRLRQGYFDNELYKGFSILLKSISYEEDELIPKRIVSLLWYIPLFMEWQKERVQQEINLKEYNSLKQNIENELERILGIH